MREDFPGRFWSKVSRGGDEECWPWMAAQYRDGYGHFVLHEKDYRAHRLAYELVRGPIRPGECVLHMCDNVRCCNPAHLFLGTKADNTRDMVRKGRHAHGKSHGSRTHPESLVRGDQHFSRSRPWILPRGSRHVRSKMTEDGVRFVLGSTESSSALSRRFNISASVICEIRKGRAWTHVERSSGVTR